MITSDPCPRVRARVAHDLKHGNTTSQSVIKFIRATCECDSCVAGKGTKKAAP